MTDRNIVHKIPKFPGSGLDIGGESRVKITLQTIAREPYAAAML
jgi:hypothetical protein